MPVEEPVEEIMTERKKRFNPREHLVNLGKGRGEYLQVKDRLVWFRDEHPDGVIATQAIEIAPDYAIFRAEIGIPAGGSATGYGSETAADFRDFLEKAETKAVGRALAALGYGTQFADDWTMENPDGTPHLVDAPVERQTSQRREPGDMRKMQPTGPGSDRATERQVKFIRAIAKEAGLDDAELEGWSQELYNQPVDQLNRRDASALIEALQRRRQETT